MARKKITRKILGRKFLISLVASLIIFFSFANIFLWTKNEIAKKERAPIKKEILYWEGVVKETPTYRDGYLKLATLYWQLKDDEKAKDNFDKAENIDPNFPGVKELKKELGY